MLQISQADVDRRLSFDNPWWTAGGDVDPGFRDLPHRSYLPSFLSLVKNRQIRRAIILMGPRRVGKTVMLQQTIRDLLQSGVSGSRILFLSLETPIYTDRPLDDFVRRFCDRFEHDRETPLTFFFDEIQYLKDWEIHLKSLVDSYPAYRFVVSGSAAAALRLASRESGAGRFTDFLLPPLTFAEYLAFVGKEDSLIRLRGGFDPPVATPDIEALNREFLHYLNHGGYPEAVFNASVRGDSGRFIKSDIIDKVLLRDLPQIHGIRDIQELNRLFMTLAYNTGNEVSLEELAQSSGVSKTTLVRYLEYLEAAFLIRRVRRIDQSARHFQRATSFKVYLTNPSMRAALFGIAEETDAAMGALAETAYFAQWFHLPDLMDNLYYARWSNGEIDLVTLDPKTQKPANAIEIKLSDRPATDPKLLRHLSAFKASNPGLTACEMTTRTYSGKSTLSDGSTVSLMPTALAVYRIGKFQFAWHQFRLSENHRMEPG